MIKADTDQQELQLKIDEYGDMLFRLCYVRLQNVQDAEDVVQEVFYQYLKSLPDFQSQEHEKAWFIRVTINACRDFFKDFFRSHMVPLEELIHQQEELTPDNSEVLEAVLSLPEKYREAVYLYYYEGYTAVEIAHILKKNKNTVYTLLTRSKQLLRERLGGDDCET